MRKGWRMRLWRRELLAIGAVAAVALATAAPAMGAVKYGSNGPDTIRGTDTRDQIYGLNGSDFINGRGGNDYPLDGGGGNDWIIGGPGDDRIHGGGGNDGYWANAEDPCAPPSGAFWRPPLCALSGGPGPDVIHGNAGTDSMVGGEGRDMLYTGSPGHDDPGTIYSYGDGAADVVVADPRVGYSRCFVDYLDWVVSCSDAWYTDWSGLISRHPNSTGGAG
jgi:Ca2+-binding RTX toxin-like protein